MFITRSELDLPIVIFELCDTFLIMPLLYLVLQ